MPRNGVFHTLDLEKSLQLQGGFAPWPPNQGIAPGSHQGLLKAPGPPLSGLWLSSEPGIPCRNEDSRGNENRKLWEKIFSVGKKFDKHTFFSIKIKMMDLWMQIEGTKQTFIMNFSGLDYSNLFPECLKLHRFSEGHAVGAHTKFPLFFSLAIPASVFSIPISDCWLQ